MHVCMYMCMHVYIASYIYIYHIHTLGPHYNIYAVPGVRGGKGYITDEDLKVFAKDSFSQYQDEESAANLRKYILSLLDLDGDGKIGLSDFVNWALWVDKTNTLAVWPPVDEE